MIRKATVADIAEIARLAIQMWEDNTLCSLSKEFEQLILSDEAAIFVADENEILGFAQCQLRRDYVEGTKTSPIGYLEGIFVAHDYRGQGWASKLLKACENWAASKGCREFASDCEVGNRASLSFHMRTGFLEANRIICFVKNIACTKE